MAETPEHPRAFGFAGGGLAGLTLAAELALAFPGRPLAIVDKHGFEGPPEFDRNIGFWCSGPPPFAELIDASWSQLAAAGPHGIQTLELEPLRYHALRWSTLRARLLTTLRACPQVELRRGHVESIEHSKADEGPARATLVLASGERLAANFAFDSRLELDALTPAPGRVLAWQRFLGLEIETPAARFDPSRAWFMDLRPSSAERVAFINVLPRSRRRALVYHVEFSPSRTGPALGPALVADLAREFGVESFEVHAEERGSLPLSDQLWQRKPGPATLAIGNAGGRLKPSSAYAFTRILADNQAILASLRRHAHPFALDPDPILFRWLDGTLLELLMRRPELGAELFEAMLRDAPTPALFALLDEHASLAQVLSIMLALPHKLALASAGLRRLLAWSRSPRRALAATSHEPGARPPRRLGPARPRDS